MDGDDFGVSDSINFVVSLSRVCCLVFVCLAIVVWWAREEVKGVEGLVWTRKVLKIGWEEG